MDRLSSRALANIAPNENMDLMGRVFSNPWSEDNPEGIVAMGIAENKLMHAEIAEYLNVHLTVSCKMLAYGDGPSGSLGLRSALAHFLNNNFAPSANQTVIGEHVTIMNGVCSVIDALCFCIAEPGDGILIVKPLYVGFLGDFEERAGVHPVCVNVGDDDVTGLAAVAHHERALLNAEENGMNIKGIMLCNPHNPLGRCYSAEVLEAYLSLCAKYSIHLISDEVYAKAVFPSKDIPNPVPFTSVLSLDVERFSDPSLVHVLYGMSKDFCANGLRIGAFISLRNPTLHAAMGTAAKFSWASSLADRAWSIMLRDEQFLERYFAEMTRKLTAAYEFCTAILREMKIPYVPASCGPFIWLDLGQFMEARTIEEERILSWRLIEYGVWLATGEAYTSEVPGWYRITFAVAEKDLNFGFDRLVKALKN